MSQFRPATVGFLLAIVFACATQPSSAGLEQLPRNLLPHHYDLRLLPWILQDGKNGTIDGSVAILVRCVNSTDKVVLNAVNIQVTDVKIRDLSAKGRQIYVEDFTVDAEREQLILHLGRGRDMKRGANYRIFIQFVSRLYEESGFYRTFYFDGGHLRTMALTQFQPTDARRAFPCFDEPNLKSDFTVTLGRPVGMTALSNMPKFQTSPVESHPGYEWDHFHRSFSMSTYLVSMAIFDGPSQSSRTVGNITLSVYARPSIANQTKKPLAVAQQLLKFYEEYFDVDYPLPKLDMIAAPGMETAMENWGLIIYGEQYLTSNQLTSTHREEFNVLTIAHELSHQWFGNLVTMDDWTDVWLNEGLATYISYIGAAEILHDFQLEQLFVIHEVQTVMQEDATSATHPIHHRPEILLTIFDSIAYKKGASVVRMLAEHLGRDTFNRALKRYLKAHAYGNAVQKDFWSYFTRQAQVEHVALPMDVQSLMSPWIFQPGYPIVTLSRNYSSASIAVKQNRFVIDERERDPLEGSTWWIPLTITSDFVNRSHIEWIGEADQVIPDPFAKDGWILANVDQAGFYRVNYDDRNWELIRHQLMHDHITVSVISRAQLIDDAFNIARAGLLDYKIAFKLADYLIQEMDYLPWQAALNAFEYVDAMFFGTEAHELFETFVTHILRPTYDRVGFNDLANWKEKSPLDLYLQTSVIDRACRLKFEDCLLESRQLFEAWMEQPDNAEIIPTHLKRTVTCTVIRGQLGDAAWEFALSQFYRSNSYGEKMLDWTFDPLNHGMDTSFVGSILNMFKESDVGKDLAYEFIVRQQSPIAWPPNNEGADERQLVNELLDSVASRFKNLSDLEMLETVTLESRHPNGGTNRILSRLHNKAETNVLWMSKNYRMIREWLREQNVESA